MNRSNKVKCYCSLLKLTKLTKRRRLEISNLSFYRRQIKRTNKQKLQGWSVRQESNRRLWRLSIRTGQVFRHRWIPVQSLVTRQSITRVTVRAHRSPQVLTCSQKVREPFQIRLVATQHPLSFNSNLISSSISSSSKWIFKTKQGSRFHKLQRVWKVQLKEDNQKK